MIHKNIMLNHTLESYFVCVCVLKKVEAVKEERIRA